MTHPMIETHRAELWRRLQQAEAELTALEESYRPPGPDEWATEEDGTMMMLEDRICRIERELDALDREAADPAAHGYR